MIIARIGRFGPMIQIGAGDDPEKQFASLLSDQSITSISLQEALDLFKLPRKLGEFENESVSAAIGRFGPYIRHGKSFVSIKTTDGDDPYTVTFERAVELITSKRDADAKSLILEWKEEPDIKVLNGRFGPYIKAGKKNVKIPKEKVAEELTLEEVRELVAQAPDKPARRKGKA
jgi:DNA topoisomerase-1